MRAFAPLAMLVLGACASPMTGPTGGTDESVATPPPISSVRYLASTEAYRGGRLYLFLFSPEAPRPLDARIAAARSHVARDPACDWIDAPRDVIIAETQKQGSAYAEKMLVAPLRCT